MKCDFQRLYHLGARRVLVSGTGPMGCAPAALAIGGTDGECAPELQLAASLYNPKLVQLITEFNQQIGSDVFSVLNIDALSLFGNGIVNIYITIKIKYIFLVFSA